MKGNQEWVVSKKLTLILSLDIQDYRLGMKSQENHSPQKIQQYCVQHDQLNIMI